MNEFIAKNVKQPLEMVNTFVEFMRTNGRAIENHCGICFYVKVDEADLEHIKRSPQFFLNIDYMRKLVLSEGQHLHIIGLYLLQKYPIWFGIDELSRLYNPKSISWWNKNTTKFYYKEMR